MSIGWILTVSASVRKKLGHSSCNSFVVLVVAETLPWQEWRSWIAVKALRFGDPLDGE